MLLITAKSLVARFGAKKLRHLLQRRSPCRVGIKGYLPLDISSHAPREHVRKKAREEKQGANATQQEGHKTGKREKKDLDKEKQSNKNTTQDNKKKNNEQNSTNFEVAPTHLTP